jgi:hypothetical protein
MNPSPLLPTIAVGALLGSAVAADPPAPAPREWSGNVNAFLGGKTLERDDWDPVEHQGAFGVQFDIQHDTWPAALVVNLMGSGATHKEDSTNVETKGSTGEIQLGVRKIWTTPGCMRFTLAGGLDLVSASRRVDTGPTTTDDKGGGAGLWASGGVYWTLWQHFNIGPQVTYSWANVTIADQNVRAGGLFAGLILGYHF